MDSHSLQTFISQTKVSSVLNRATKEYGKKFMFDGSEDTCWNSDQGSPQFVAIDFCKAINLNTIKIQFQGGFAGKVCTLDVVKDTKENLTLQKLYPEDVNTLQSFEVQNATDILSLKITFESSTDFFGRIIVYTLELLGSESIDK